MRRHSLVRAALVIIAAVTLVIVAAPAQAQLNQTGQWTTLPNLSPVSPIHVAVLHTGKVLMIEGSSNDSHQSTYRYAIWDPSTNSFTTVGTTPWDLFCNSMAFLPDGRLLISGGNLGYNPYRGIKTAVIFDPATEKFVQVEDMARGRWYPTAIGLADGGVMSFSGLDEVAAVNPLTEIYDVGGGWSGPWQAQFEPKYYPRMHVLNNGKVVLTGPDPYTRVFDPATGLWSGVMATMASTDGRMYGSSVMLPLRPADGYHTQFVAMGGNTTAPISTVELLDTANANWTWTSLPPLDQARVTHNSVLLPSGKIVVIGGSAQFNVASTAAMNALMWDPATYGFSPAGTIAYPRMYHSTAVLLPDATVWLGGSNPSEGVWEPHMEIYKPPYLFTSTGALAPRPTISAAPASAGFSDNFVVSTPDPASIKDVILMRTPSATHAFDMEQRLLYTNFTRGTGTLTVTAPGSSEVAPPGYYYLFLIDQNGVPSVAKFIRLVKHPGNQPPTATITNPSADVSIAAGQTVTFAGSASDPDGSVALYSWIFPGGSPATSHAQNPGAVSFPTPGVYTVSLTVLDNLGDNNVSPPTVTVTVGGTSALGAAITSPVSGASVSGTLAVNMTATNAQGSPTQFVLKLDNVTTLSTQSVAGAGASYAWNTTTGPDGSPTLGLTVPDGAGRTATATVTVTVANTTGGGGGGAAPSVSITTPASGTWTGNSIDIGVSASSSVGLASIKLWGNGGIFATIPCSGATCTGTVTWITGSLPPAAYQVQAVATDTAGAFTTSAAVTINKDATTPVIASGAPASGGGAPAPPPSGGGDTTPPAASITAPASGSWTGNSITVSASATDNVGLARLDIWGNGGVIATIACSRTACSGDTTWITGPLAPAAYQVQAVATDTSGNATTSAAVTIYKDATTPVIASGAPASGAGGTVPLTASLTSPANGATVSGAGVTVTMAAGNAQGTPTQFVLELDNATTLSSQSVAGSTATFTWDTTLVPNGTHTLDLTVTDSAARTARASITVNVANTAGGGGGATDTTAPSVTLLKPANGAWTGNSIDIAATATDNVALTSIAIYGDGALVQTIGCGGTASCNTGDVWWLTGSLPAGQHTVSAVATDSSGNQQTTAVTINR